MPKTKSKEPGLTKDGKKDWTGFFKGMSDQEIVTWCADNLKKMPMTYLKAAGQRLGQVRGL